MTPRENYLYFRESWSGDSRDGDLVNGDGFHFFKMDIQGKILEAYEYYETDDGIEVVTKLPDMVGVGWVADLGFEDFEVLDKVTNREFVYIQNIYKKRLPPVQP